MNGRPAKTGAGGMLRCALAVLAAGIAFAAPAAYMPSSALRMVSYNIRHCQGADGKVNIARVANVIAKEKPDIVGLNEVDVKARRSGGADEPTLLARRLGMHATFAKAKRVNGGSYGNAILSREPPISVERIPLPGKEPRVLLLCEFRNFWFGTMHLDFNQYQLPAVEIVRRVVAKKSATKPVFLTGDWNANPSTKTLSAVRGFMKILSRTNLRTFQSFGKAPLGAKSCIDYIAVDLAHASKVFVREAHVTENLEASDHNPIAVSVSMRFLRSGVR